MIIIIITIIVIIIIYKKSIGYFRNDIPNMLVYADHNNSDVINSRIIA